MIRTVISILIALGSLDLVAGGWVNCSDLLILNGKSVLVAFSGGPDAAALAATLIAFGATPVPVYITYRSGGGKTTKDLRSAHLAAELLGIGKLHVIKKPLGTRPKSERNRFFIETLSALDAPFLGLGTLNEDEDPDLDPNILGEAAEAHDRWLVTWDSFGVKTKAEQFLILEDSQRAAIYATTSCQMWWKLECGNCYSCVARHLAFLQAFGEDPTQYRLGTKCGPREK